MFKEIQTGGLGRTQGRKIPKFERGETASVVTAGKKSESRGLTAAKREEGQHFLTPPFEVARAPAMPGPETRRSLYILLTGDVLI